ncbi:carbohydrate ABC transporter permease, partial [Streptomyces sp. SID11233]|nr:carbohydrate ABC transporter permease [Streptomyces sp. SID11233]
MSDTAALPRTAEESAQEPAGTTAGRRAPRPREPKPHETLPAALRMRPRGKVLRGVLLVVAALVTVFPFYAMVVL